MKMIFLNFTNTHMDNPHFQDDPLLLTVYTYISLTITVQSFKKMKNVCKMLWV